MSGGGGVNTQTGNRTKVESKDRLTEDLTDTEITRGQVT